MFGADTLGRLGTQLTTLDAWRVYVDFGLLILIWLVQLIIYPSFAHVREDVFIKWHNQYTGLISLFVAPLMLGQSVLCAGLLLLAGRPLDLFQVVMVLIVWLSTIFLSVPCHSRMHKIGYEPATIQRLVRTNWIRTIAWTLMVCADFVPGSMETFS